MPWKRAEFKDKQVWAQVDEAGQPVVEGGRVPIRYSDKPGAKVYRAGSGRVALADTEAVELAEGVSADAAKQGGKKGRGSGFGSAGTRTQAQAALAKEAARELVDGFAEDTVVCFTDGACRGNPGPCGAGAVVKLPDGTRVERYAALGKGTNNIGELTAIGLALDLVEEHGVADDVQVEILSDSKYSKGVLSMGWKAKANRELILGLRGRLAKRNVNIHWIAGHVGIPENERADELANMGVAESA